MKLSDWMELGYSYVGKQCFGCTHIGPSSSPIQVCALSAARFAKYGDAQEYLGDEYGHDLKYYVVRLNDHCKMPIPEIIEVLRSMGL